MADALTVSGLNVTFGGKTALRDISFKLEKGDALAVIGPNGAGKSVLLRALLGMIPYRGTIAWAPGTRIGYVPQKIDADRHLPINFHNLLAAKSATLRLAKAEAGAVADAVGITKKILETPVGHLSGGQFQRALIAFALLGLPSSTSHDEARLGEPSVLLLDEPTASIDESGEEQVYELVHRLQDQYDMTTILVSHDLNFVYQYATKVLCLRTSELCFGPPDEALTKDVLEKLYGPHKYFHHFHHLHDPH
ncbi:MAG: metal ABC transporter ATP-binding protein [Minisyncoccia bacterium]|jgi:zinc transport system ATP-binding protein